MSSQLTVSPHSEVEWCRSNPVQSIQVSLVINQQLEHLVSSIEGRVVKRSLLILILDIHREGAALQQTLHNLRKSLGGAVVQYCLLGVLVDIKVRELLGKPDENVVAAVDV